MTLTAVHFENGDKAEFDFGVGEVLPDGRLKIVDMSGVNDTVVLEDGEWRSVFIIAARDQS